MFLAPTIVVDTHGQRGRLVVGCGVDVVLSREGVMTVIGYTRDDGQVLCFACAEQDMESDKPVIHDYLDILDDADESLTCDRCGANLLRSHIS